MVFKMKLQICSDLHLEFSDIEIKNSQKADLLLLCGDILVVEDLHQNPPQELPIDFAHKQKLRAAKFREFLKRVSGEFPNVLYVMGNHEFYHGKWYGAVDYLKEALVPYSNIHFLNNGKYELDDYLFLGGTMWTNLMNSDPICEMELRNKMNDYRVIKNDKKQYSSIRPFDTKIRHVETLNFFQNEINSMRATTNPKKIVVMTHHAPSLRSLDPRYKSDIYMNGGYASDLDQFIEDSPEIILWAHGHIHTANDYQIGNCRVVCNPRGYESALHNENTGWNPNFEVEI